MSRYAFTHEGERWSVGYDKQDATYFLDRDSDLDRDDYTPPRMPTFDRLMAQAPVPVPQVLVDELRDQDPVSARSAEASVIARIDQLGGAVRASYPAAATEAVRRSPDAGPQASHETPRFGATGRGADGRGE